MGSRRTFSAPVEGCYGVCVHAALRRLAGDPVDVLYLHRSDCSTPDEETLTAMRELVEAETLCNRGVSDYSARKTAELQRAATRLGLASAVLGRQTYNVIHRLEGRWLTPEPHQPGGESSATDVLRVYSAGTAVMSAPAPVVTATGTRTARDQGILGFHGPRQCLEGDAHP
ncbi:aldo/keto reductase [Curtobacterium flaccumfaciens pv. flaccumfaciens]|uniref:aldo/keto reductase n=1 Tax=Curtobacterium flaccumfaciens TaxID=2035 RepID=UPI0039944FB9